MLLFEGFSLFRKLFSFFGLAPIFNKNSKENKDNAKDNIFKSVLGSLPSIVFIILSCVQIIIQTTLNFVDDYGIIHLIILKLYFLITAASNVIANIQCLLYKLEYYDIIRRIQHIEHLLMTKFSKEIDIKKIMVKYKIKFFTVFLLLISLELMSCILTPWDPAAFTLAIVRGILEIIYTMTCLHPILYVDIVRMYIKELSSALIQSKSYFQFSTVIIDRTNKLNDIRLVYFKLWKLVQKINIYFGWSIVIMLIKFFIDITFDLYWIFIEFQQHSWQSVSHISN